MNKTSFLILVTMEQTLITDIECFTVQAFLYPKGALYWEIVHSFKAVGAMRKCF